MADISTDRLRVQAQLEQLQNKYVGVGHPDTTKYEWLCNQHRDTYASLIGHPDLLSYCAIAQSMRREQVRAHFLEKMILPCGPKPPDPLENEP